MTYHPAPTASAPTTSPDNAFHFQNEVPLYATILGKQVKGLGWFGGEHNPNYYYDYSVPVNTNGDLLTIQFKFARLTSQQILTKQPLIDTILSTVKLDN
jgi:hypothetical protein